MKLEIVLNPNLPQYQEVVEGLEEELRALKGLTYERVTEPPPAKTLAIDQNVLQFLFQLKDTVGTKEIVGLATVLLQIVNTVLLRVHAKPKKDSPSAVIVVGDRTLRLPGSPQAQKRYLSQLSKKQEKTPAPKKAAKKKSKK